MNPPLNLEHLLELAGKATPGPWRRPFGSLCRIHRAENEEDCGGRNGQLGEFYKSEDNVFVIALNPSVVTQLITELIEARKVIEFYADLKSWYLHTDPHTLSEIRRSIEYFDTESSSRMDEKGNNILTVNGGKRAREFQEKYGK